MAVCAEIINIGAMDAVVSVFKFALCFSEPHSARSNMDARELPSRSTIGADCFEFDAPRSSLSPERRIGREITVTDGLERRSRRQLPDPLRPLGRHLPRYSRDRSATAAAVAVAAVCLSASVSISAVRPSRKVTRSRAVSTPAGRGVETIGMQRAHQRLDNGAWARAARPGRHAGKAFQSSADPASAASVSR
jgi:hypothetical protein